MTSRTNLWQSLFCVSTEAPAISMLEHDNYPKTKFPLMLFTKL